MTDSEFQGEFYNPAADNYNRAEIDKSRGPRLTLRHLNKLKKMRTAKDLENLVREDFLEVIYGSPPAAEGGGI